MEIYGKYYRPRKVNAVETKSTSSQVRKVEPVQHTSSRSLICPNCGHSLGCSCNIMTGKDGKRYCIYCYKG